MGKTISRRRLLVSASAGAAVAAQLNRGSAQTQPAANATRPTVSDTAFPNESPHPSHAKFSEIPLRCIEPQGWLKGYLTNQKNGLTGHLDETGGFPFNTYGWAGPAINDQWWTYEQTAYWIDGMTRCGHLLRDKELIDKASRHINYVLEHADADGYLGPQYLKARNRWPHAVFFRALMAHSSATGDPRVVQAIKRHFISSPYKYAGGRDICNMEAMLWAYDRDQDPRLLTMAQEAYKTMATARGTTPEMFMDGKPSTAHGVSYNEIGKLGAVLYAYTGDPDCLELTTLAYQKLDRFHMLPEGVNTSTEALKPVDPLASHETCDITDYCWGIGYLLMAGGTAECADKIERASFNALPGAVTEDFQGLQYFSCPNQVIAAHNSNHNLFYKGNRGMQYGPGHLDIAQCCPGNVNRAMPNFAARMWLKDANNGLVAALYGPSKVTYQPGASRQEVTITENTRYPFSDRIVFTMQMARDTKFPFTVRIPGWCNSASVTVNGQALNQAVAPGTFVTIDRTFRDKDEVVVTLPQELKATMWPLDGIAIERGPLVYSLRIDENWESQEQVAEAAAVLIGCYDINSKYPGLVGRNAYPKSAWNYALDVDPNGLAKSVQISEGEWRDDQPFSRSAPPIMLRVPAQQVNGWKLDEMDELVQQGDWDHPQAMHTRKGHFVLTPQLPAPGSGAKLADARETITLVPYGCARLRVTIFPQASSFRG